MGINNMWIRNNSKSKGVPFDRFIVPTVRVNGHTIDMPLGEKFDCAVIPDCTIPYSPPSLIILDVPLHFPPYEGVPIPSIGGILARADNFTPEALSLGVLIRAKLDTVSNNLINVGEITIFQNGEFVIPIDFSKAGEEISYLVPFPDSAISIATIDNLIISPLFSVIIDPLPVHTQFQLSCTTSAAPDFWINLFVFSRAPSGIYAILDGDDNLVDFGANILPNPYLHEKGGPDYGFGTGTAFYATVPPSSKIPGTIWKVTHDNDVIHTAVVPNCT
jgi:hypothetical protein